MTDTGGFMAVGYAAPFLLLQCVVTMAGRQLSCSSSQNTIECFAHYFKGNQDCFPGSLISRFPDLYSRNGNGAPERPSDLILTPFEKLYESYGKYYLGVHFSIQPPKTASVNYVKGFEVRFSTVDLDSGSIIGKPRCIVFNFSSSFLNYTYRKTKFSIDIYPLDRGLRTFRVYSLPKPSTEEDTVRMFREASVVNFQYGYKGDESHRWSTSITYSVEYEHGDIHGSIMYSFTASALYDFPSYQVKLFMKDVYYPVRNLTIPRANVTGRHAFVKLPPGEYEIKIQPYDPSKLFACVDQHGSPVTCTTTKSRFIKISDNGGVFSVEANSPESITTQISNDNYSILYESKTMNKDNNGGSSNNKNNEYTMGQTIGAIVGSVVGVILLVLLTYCGYNRKTMNETEDIEGRRKHHTEGGGADCFGIHKDSELGVENEIGSSCLRKREDIRKRDAYEVNRKSMVIVYTSDNSFHEDAVRKLGVYLRERCGMTVYVECCPIESDPQKISSLANFINSKTIFVFMCSPLAYHLYNEKNGVSTSNTVQQLIKYLDHTENSTINTERQNFVSVAFDYPETKQFFVPEIFHHETFVLLEDLDKMVTHISHRMALTTYFGSLGSANRSIDELEEATKIAILFYIENYSFDRKTECISYSQGLKSRPLESISNVLQTNGGHGFDKRGQTFRDTNPTMTVRADIEDYPSLPFHFHPPSESFLPDDIPTTVMADDIEKLNNRNLDLDALYLCDEEHKQCCLGFGTHIDEECISIGSAKSV